MLHKLCSVQLGPLYDGDVMSQCDSLWILKPCHIGGIMRCINLWWIKYDVTDGLGVKRTARHCCRYTVAQCGGVHEFQIFTFSIST